MDIPYFREELLSQYLKYHDFQPMYVEQMKLYSLRNMLESADAIIDKTISQCYPIITSCSDYPSCLSNDNIEARTISISRREKIDLNNTLWTDRLHVAAISCYTVIRNYVISQRSISYLEYVENRLPLRYIRTLKHEIESCRTGNIPYKKNDTICKGIPGSPREYIEMYIKDNVSEFTRDYFPYLGRTNMYRLIRKLDIF